MSYLPDDTPFPEPAPDESTYWNFCRQKMLKIQQCVGCGRFRHPPMPFCGSCGSDEVAWSEVSGNGTVFSYTVVHHPAHPALKSATPYNVAVVMLDDADDVRLVSNIIDVAPEELHIDLPVSLVWEPAIDGGYLPRFRRRRAGGA